mmetsp:Transcript_12513/g.14599  ORF Transcript_12513/g.14599 Transcript_12513/m.14599 type:complete len:176 (-) Transcript_12513:879-1406(-)
MNSSFILSNICPQHPWLNRNYWSWFESFIRQLVLNSIFEEVHVVTGPLFLPNDEGWVKYKVIGNNNVAVPTHFYKIVVAQKANEVFQGGFLIPNSTFPEGRALIDFVVPIETIEQHSGHKFFPFLKDNFQFLRLHPNEKQRQRKSLPEKHLCSEVECGLVKERATNILNPTRKKT